MTKQYKGRTATIEIDEKNVIIKSSGFFSSSKKTIPLRDIKNVELSASSFFSKDTVETGEHLHSGNLRDLPHRYLELAYLLPPP